MPIACHYCSQACAADTGFCPRCGGQLSASTAFEHLLYRATQITTLVRSRAWGYLERNADRIKKVLDDDPSAVVPELLLHQIGQDLESLLDNDHNVPRILRVGSKLLALFPQSALPELRTHHTRHITLHEGLSQIQRDLESGGWLKRQMVRKRLRSLASRCEIGETEVITCVIATPEVWPQIAAELQEEYVYQGNSARAHTNRGYREIAAGNYAAARRHFDAAVAKDKDCIRAHEGQAKVCLLTKDYPGAVGHYRLAINAGSRSVATYNNLSWYLCKTSSAPNDLAEAVFAARSAVERVPVAKFWDTLAEASLRQGNPAGAIVATRLAIQEDPDTRGYRERMKLLTGASATPERVSQNGDEQESREHMGWQGVSSQGGSRPCIIDDLSTGEAGRNGELNDDDDDIVIVITDDDS